MRAWGGAGRASETGQDGRHLRRGSGKLDTGVQGHRGTREPAGEGRKSGTTKGVVGVPLRPVVGQGHFPALPESCLVAVLTRPSGTALWG